MYKSIFTEKKIKEEVNVKEIIDELIDTNWSGSNEEQGKAVQLLRGLAFSDEPLSNKFMKELDKATSSMKKDDFKESVKEEVEDEEEDKEKEDDEEMDEALPQTYRKKKKESTSERYQPIFTEEEKPEEDEKEDEEEMEESPIHQMMRKKK